MAQTHDPLDSILLSCPELKAPDGFAERLQKRLEDTTPCAKQPNRLQFWGAVCVASAAALFIVFNTPVLNVIPLIFESLGGLLQ